MRSTEEHQKQNRGTSDGLRSTERTGEEEEIHQRTSNGLRSIKRTGEEEEDDEDEELIWKENGGTRVSKTRVLYGIHQILHLSSFKNSSSNIDLEF